MAGIRLQHTVHRTMCLSDVRMGLVHLLIGPSRWWRRPRRWRPWRSVLGHRRDVIVPRSGRPRCHARPLVVRRIRFRPERWSRRAPCRPGASAPRAPLRLVLSILVLVLVSLSTAVDTTLCVSLAFMFYVSKFRRKNHKW